MQKRGFKKPRFALDRTRRGDLARQLADGLRTAIETGYYRPGDILPPVRDLAEILEVSKGIAEQAVAKIREEGLISPRPAVGSVVCDRSRQLWKGCVLIVVPPGAGNTADTAMAAVLRDALTANGYLALAVTVPRKADGRFDFALLDLMTRQQTDLVVQLHDKPEIARWLSARKLPFACVTRGMSGRRPRGCIGEIRRSSEVADAAFAAHCREKGVRRVTVVTVWERKPLYDTLRAAGLAVTEWKVDVPVSGLQGSALAMRAMELVEARLRRRDGSRWPELLFLADDYIASGALTALLAADISVPKDIPVAAWFNRTGGSGLAFPVPLTRMEVDTLEYGRAVADAVLAYLRTGTFPPDVTIGPAYVRGDSF